MYSFFLDNKPYRYFSDSGNIMFIVLFILLCSAHGASCTVRCSRHSVAAGRHDRPGKVPFSRPSVPVTCSIQKP